MAKDIANKDFLKKVKNFVIEKSENKVKETFQQVLSHSQPNYKRINNYKQKYKGYSSEYIANRIIKMASRKTGTNGIAIGSIITAAEASSFINVPAGIAITGGAILEDLGVTVGIQLQLIVDITALYECPFNLDDEEDAFIIFLMALGVKKEDELFRGFQQIINEAGIKNFRKLLRYKKIRSKIQDKIGKILGQKAAKLLAEKQMLKLIPAASIIISGVINHSSTTNVGRFAIRYGKVRSAIYNHIEKIELISSKYDSLILYTLRYITEYYNDKSVDEFAMVWRSATPKMHLTQEQIDEVEKCDNVQENYFDLLSELDDDDIKEELYSLAETIIATAKPNTAKKYIDCLKNIAEKLDLDFSEENFKDRLDYFKIRQKAKIIK